MSAKKRLDLLLTQQYPQLSRQKIQSFIMQGLVTVNGVVVTKVGEQVTETDRINLTEKQMPYVSRAGIKLAHALDTFGIDVTGLTALDAGISTGGFTDCMLQHGASKVYGVDVGYGQVQYKIRQDSRVILFERTNLRYFNPNDLGEKVDLVTLDLSFISILKVLPVVKQILKPSGHLLTLIKPQFEGQREQIGAGGIVRDDHVRTAIVQSVLEGLKESGFSVIATCESPITGTDGNREYFAYCSVASQFAAS
jgi:23S rRNA (cytidine1920-2'-O)/16S rRNA (cytidine1409-2'-O)-methyltransferase